MNKYNALKSKMKNLSRAALASAAAVGSSMALAIDDTVVTAAQTAAETSVTNASNGLIGIVAIIVGIGMVIALLRKA